MHACRDLHAKYGRDSNTSKASKDRDSLDNMLAARMTTLMHESRMQQHAKAQELQADRQTGEHPPHRVPPAGGMVPEY